MFKEKNIYREKNMLQMIFLNKLNTKLTRNFARVWNEHKEVQKFKKKKLMMNLFPWSSNTILPFLLVFPFLT